MAESLVAFGAEAVRVTAAAAEGLVTGVADGIAVILALFDPALVAINDESMMVTTTKRVGRFAARAADTIPVINHVTNSPEGLDVVDSLRIEANGSQGTALDGHCAENASDDLRVEEEPLRPYPEVNVLQHLGVHEGDQARSSQVVALDAEIEGPHDGLGAYSTEERGQGFVVEQGGGIGELKRDPVELKRAP